MQDYGNTGPVTEASSPAPMTPVPTEDEMTKLQDIFRRAAQAIVDVSGLSKTVAELSAKVETLTKDIDGYRDRVRWLDQELSEVREARNAQRERADRAEAEANSFKIERDRGLSTIDALRLDIEAIRGNYDRASYERDDAQFRVMELEEKLSKVEEQFSRIREFAVSEFGLEVPKPPTVEPPPMVVTPEPVPETPLPSGSVPAPKPSVDFSKPHRWNNTIGDFENY